MINTENALVNFDNHPTKAHACLLQMIVNDWWDLFCYLII